MAGAEVVGEGEKTTEGKHCAYMGEVVSCVYVGEGELVWDVV